MKLLTLLAAVFLVSVEAGWLRTPHPRPVNWKDMKPSPLRDGEERIIGGELATYGQFPYQVAVTIDDSVFCGGSLISDLHVLTAGHCASLRTSFEVWMGTTNRSDPTESGRVIMTTTEKLVHTLYLLTPNNEYDIALLYLPTAVQTSAVIQPIRLPKLSDVGELYVGVVGIVSGWGRIADDQPGAVDDLRYVDLPVVDSSVCLEHYGFSVSSQLCLSTENGKGSCSGDSGGPYVYDEGDGILTEIGLVSYGSSAGCVAGPKGYMRVAYFVQWIQDNTGIPIRP